MMKKIKLYGFETCPECPPAKEFLTKHNIEYDYIDVKSSEEAMSEWLTLRSRLKDMNFEGKVGVPAFVIGEEIIIGLDESRLLKVYEKYSI